MKKLIILILGLTPLVSSAHECDKFMNEDWAADEAYACKASTSDLQKYKLHRLEVCVGSVPYQNRRYAHAQLKWVPLNQYSNQWNRNDGTESKFFDSFYSGLAFNDTNDFREDSSSLVFAALREGSTILHQRDILTGLKLNKNTGQAQMKVSSREPALLFSKAWQTNWDLNLKCHKIR